MSVNIYRNGKIVGQSQNLHGIITYSRDHKTWVKSIDMTRNADGTGNLAVMWGDGASTTAQFADFVVMVDWVLQRRSWIGASVSVQNVPAGEYNTELIRSIYQGAVRAAR